ncbi:MAG: DUF4363 family protein [Clostridia bacterium]|nr:DUF4363 family protein [Clostridia bacterium]
MNRFIIAVVMLLIAGIICGCEIFTVTAYSVDYKEDLDTVKRLMEEESYYDAYKLSEKTIESWQKAARHLDKYLYHDYIDDITVKMSALPVYAQNEDTQAVNAQVEEIKKQLTSLKESELPYMHNIL